MENKILMIIFSRNWAKRGVKCKSWARLGKKIDAVPQEVMDALTAYHWPGNVRELQNLLELSVILSTGSTLKLARLSELNDATADADTNGQALRDVERSHIVKTLESCAWKVSGKGNAADRLGLKPSTLRFRMGKLGIARPNATG